MEMLNDFLRPKQAEDGTWVFTVPLADGAMPLIHLADLARFTLWAFENPEKSSGLELGVATEHVSGALMAEAFTSVTGLPAKYNAIPIEAWVKLAFSHLPKGPDTKIGARGKGAIEDDTTFMTRGENFTNWWNLYQASGGNKGLIQRDYKLLDEILPTRVKSLEEWMKRVDYRGEQKNVLKDRTDGES
jgi:hypothetical protein